MQHPAPTTIFSKPTRLGPRDEREHSYQRNVDWSSGKGISQSLLIDSSYSRKPWWLEAGHFQRKEKTGLADHPEHIINSTITKFCTPRTMANQKIRDTKEPNRLRLLGAVHHIQGVLLFFYGLWIGISQITTNYYDETQNDSLGAGAIAGLINLFGYVTLTYFILFSLLSMLAGSKLKNQRWRIFCKAFSLSQCVWSLPGVFMGLFFLIDGDPSYHPRWQSLLAVSIFLGIFVVGIVTFLFLSGTSVKNLFANGPLPPPLPPTGRSPEESAPKITKVTKQWTQGIPSKCSSPSAFALDAGRVPDRRVRPCL